MESRVTDFIHASTLTLSDITVILLPAVSHPVLQTPPSTETQAFVRHVIKSVWRSCWLNDFVQYRRVLKPCTVDARGAWEKKKQPLAPYGARSGSVSF